MTADASTPGQDTGEFPALNGEAQAGPARVSVRAAGKTHPGRVRQNNEDHFLVARLAKAMRVLASSLDGGEPTRFSDEEGYLMIVADGMGGAAAGEKASSLAVRTVEDFALETLKWFLHLRGKDEDLLLNELRTAIERADRNVIEQARVNPRQRGMGTTLTMAYSVATDLYIIHAGDSRAYLFRDGELSRLTTDHTLVQMLVDGGTITAEAAKTHERRNVVTNVVGGPQQGVYVEIHKTRLRDGDTLLLCSDGLTEPVDEPEIARALAEHADDPRASCRTLIDLALDHGGPDNVTAVVARYSVGSD